MLAGALNLLKLRRGECRGHLRQLHVVVRGGVFLTSRGLPLEQPDGVVADGSAVCPVGTFGVYACPAVGGDWIANFPLTVADTEMLEREVRVRSSVGRDVLTERLEERASRCSARRRVPCRFRPQMQFRRSRSLPDVALLPRRRLRRNCGFRQGPPAMRAAYLGRRSAPCLPSTGAAQEIGECVSGAGRI